MTIATEKVKQASERFLLARLNPSRFILPVLNGGLYEITLPFIINSLSRNGTLLTKVTSAPVSNDNWYQNEDTKLLQVKLASAPNDTSNILVCGYYLFYTGTIFRSIYETPTDNASPIRQWEPKISRYPSITQSFENIIEGIFSLSDTRLDIINTDKTLQNYLTVDDSFYNRPVEFWLCINDSGNIIKVFDGTVKSLSIQKNSVTFVCADIFNKLKVPAYMGDTKDEVYLGTTNYPNAYSRNKDKPIPYIAGRYSKHTVYKGTEIASGAPSGHFDVDENEAFCLSSEDPSITENREWLCCRQKDAVQIQNWGTNSDSANFGSFTFCNFSILQNVQIGDTLEFTNGGPTYYGAVVWNKPFVYSSVNYNCIINTFYGGANVATTGGGLTTVNNPSFACMFYADNGNKKSTLLYNSDYTIDDTATTSAGNRYVKVTLVNNVENTVSLGRSLDLAKDSVHYRTSVNNADTHSSILKDMLEYSGMVVDTASFTAAQTAFDEEVAFQIPQFDENDYKTYLDYAEAVLSSVLGYLKVNDQQEIEYEILTAPGAGDLRDGSLMLRDRSGVAVNYQDIITEIIASNPHNDDIIEIAQTPSPAETRTNNKAKYLHKIDNSVRFRHVLRTITDRIDEHIGLKSMRSAKYRLETATEDLDTTLGTDLSLENNIVLGGSGSVNVKVNYIERNPSSTTIEATDLEGL